MRERTVKIGSAGKIFSLTGWKVGFVCAAPTLAEGARQGAPVPHLHDPAQPAGGGRLRPRQGRCLFRRPCAPDFAAAATDSRPGSKTLRLRGAPEPRAPIFCTSTSPPRRSRRRRRLLPTASSPSTASPRSRSRPSMRKGAVHQRRALLLRQEGRDAGRGAGEAGGGGGEGLTARRADTAAERWGRELPSFRPQTRSRRSDSRRSRQIAQSSFSARPRTTRTTASSTTRRAAECSTIPTARARMWR